MLNIGRREHLPAGRRHRRGRAESASPRHPVYGADTTPEWVGTEDDPQWVRTREQIRTFKRMKDVQRAVQECQVAVAHLASFSDGPGPVGHVARRALQSLVLDVHAEVRAADAFVIHQVPSRHRFRRAGSLIDWMLSPVGSGDRSLGAEDQAVSRSFRAVVAFRMIGAALAALALVLQMPVAALLVLVGSAASSGWFRYRDNLEPGVTFRARYISCLLGHAGDVLVLWAATFWLWRIGAAWWPAPITVAVMLFATIVRTGALQVGVSIDRRRLDRVVRVGSTSVGVALVALGSQTGFVATFVLMTVVCAWQTYGILRQVWSADVTEFAWMLSTSDGYTGSLATAPLPQRTDSDVTT